LRCWWREVVMTGNQIYTTRLALPFFQLAAVDLDTISLSITISHI
jgi:hypothetical protein